MLPMAVLALGLIAVWVLLVGGLRTLIQILRTGDAGIPVPRPTWFSAVVAASAVWTRLRLRRRRPV